MDLVDIEFGSISNIVDFNRCVVCILMFLDDGDDVCNDGFIYKWFYFLRLK